MININGYEDNHLKQTISINSINSSTSQSSYKVFISNLTTSSFQSPIKSKFNFDSENYNPHNHPNSYNKVYANYNPNKEKSFKRFSSLLSLNNEPKLTHQRKSSLSLNLGFGGSSFGNRKKKLVISNPIINNLTKEKLKNKLKNSSIIYSIPINENDTSINELFKFCNNKKIMNLHKFLSNGNTYNEVPKNVDIIDIEENEENIESDIKEDVEILKQLDAEEYEYIENKENKPIRFIKIMPFNNVPTDISKILKYLKKNDKLSNIPGLVNFPTINIIKNDNQSTNILNLKIQKQFSLIMSTAYIGIKLSNFKFTNWFQVLKIFWKICFIMNMSEILIDLEHRWLILDNIYLNVNGNDIDISIMNFKFSRFKVNNEIYAQDYSILGINHAKDEGIMKLLSKLNPALFSKKTNSNIYWINYIISQLCEIDIEDKDENFDKLIKARNYIDENDKLVKISDFLRWGNSQNLMI